VSVERNLIISVLKLTKEGPVLTESINSETRLPIKTMKILLRKLQNEGVINLETETVIVDSEGRLKLAVKAAALGADVEVISHLLCWREFEELAAFALKSHGYNVLNNVRFKHAGKRYEIDVVGSRKPLVICIDCKHWQKTIGSSSLRKIVEAQIERSKAFADSLPNPKLNLDCTKWSKAKFLPSIISLFPCPFKYYYEVPVVPILQLQDFLNQLPVHTESLKYFSKGFTGLGYDF
jgi:Holliday junction resolvase-like predicted endonuclease